MRRRSPSPLNAADPHLVETMETMRVAFCIFAIQMPALRTTHCSRASMETVRVARSLTPDEEEKEPDAQEHSKQHLKQKY